MSNSKMLIDATHPEETRVVVQRNGRVEEFDFESAARKLLRGNIYLAKVTRVEPSLQAAFVDYGGNRHGFLAFNEIHPDYYQIPVADRQALIDEEAAAEAELEAAADRRAEALERRARQRKPQAERPAAPEHAPAQGDDDETEEAAEGGISNIVDVEEDEHIEVIGGEDGDEEVPTTFAAAVGVREEVITEDVSLRSGAGVEEDERHEPAATDAARAAALASQAADDDAADADEDDHARDHAIDEREPVKGADAHEHHEGEAEHHDDDDHDHHDHHDHAHDDEHSDEHGGHHHAEHHHASLTGEASPARAESDLLEEVPVRPRRRPRSYKIQEVIKRRQVILVQVVKEERGNKGAALTTYLSLAGRYTVLMPNTARGGGISRKITNPQDRKRLKAIAQELDVPEGMGLIIRTAGAARTKQEIKRDFEYLLRLWESVRDLTLQSTAPSLVYEEGDLIKRSIRDLYNKDVEEVVVAGDGGYREAADFMRMLLPSHSKNVIQYNDPTPLFARYGVERQLNAMFSPQVTLRSGGYIVINQTEALVAIDVNSGKSTREFSIEETALATNLEAADEIARQLKLRDLAGLIVIDFIDMEEKRNNRAVERRLKDALRHDRARIQLGRISHFGLMEMSRQRLRTGVLEGSTSQCQHCQGTGIIRSTESIALAVLRGLEDAITAGSQAPLVATTTTAVALYILNSKRAYVADMEARHGYSVTVLGSDRIHGANFTIERGAASALPQRRPERAAVNMDWGFEGEDDEAPAFEPIETASDDDAGEEESPARFERPQSRESSEEEGGRGRRRRRRRRGGRRGDRGDDAARPNFSNGAAADEDDDIEDVVIVNGEDESGESEADTASDNELEAQDAAGPAAEGDDSANGNGERRRRRRRGRRGGRRGRNDRDNGEARQPNASGAEPLDEGDEADDGSAGESDREGEGEGEDLRDPNPTLPGFEPQPDIGHHDALSTTNGEHAAAAEAVEPRPEPRRGRGERRRPERIWDAPAPQADAANGDGADEAAAPSSAREPAPEVKPARQTAKERAAAAEEASETAAGQPVIEQRQPEPRQRRHELGSSEPRIERVVVRTDSSAEGSDEETPAPQRKGWWQRRFGG